MRIKTRTLVSQILLILLLIFSVQKTQAFSNCKVAALKPQVLASAHDLAALTADFLDECKEQNKVLIVARSGQNLSAYGLKHSHVAFLVLDQEGNWQAVHLLNECNSNKSNLYREGLVNFISDNAANPNGLRIGILDVKLQQTLAYILTPPASQVRFLHQKNYSAVAYPFAAEFQNSNGWVLEVIAAAFALNEEDLILSNRKASTAWLKQNNYQPTFLSFALLKRLGAGLFVKNVALTDHPASERLSGNYSLVTVESIFDFLQAKKALMQEITLTLPNNLN